MVKGGDDLRQELLASQIIEQFSAIFQAWHGAAVPVWGWHVCTAFARGISRVFIDVLSLQTRLHILH